MLSLLWICIPKVKIKVKDETFPVEINHNPVVEVIKEIDDIKDKPNEEKA